MLMPSIFGENVWNGFFDDFGIAWPEKKSPSRSAAMPAIMKTDVKESDTGYELDIDLPGYGKEDIKAELKDGYLTISAETKTDSEKKEETGTYIRRERYFGKCSRRFFVGEEIEPEDIKARFENGILSLSIPKKEAKEKPEENRFVTIEG